MTVHAAGTIVTDIDFDEAWKTVIEAAQPSDVFGPEAGPARFLYRRLARTLHPDRSNDPRATDAFARLEALWTAYQSGGTSPNGGPLHIVTKARAYIVGDVLASGDLSNVYFAQYQEDGVTADAALKMVRSPKNSDLMQTEAKALRQMASQGDPTFAPYVPQLLETFRHKDSGTGIERQVNVVNFLDGFYTLAEVRKQFPNGVATKDVAWMWRRLLVALGYAHHAGVVHGAVTPDNVMVHPALHGLVLVDWCFSTTDISSAPKVITPKWPSIYPPTRRDITELMEPQRDLYMATRTIEWMLDADAPPAIRAFIKGCTIKQPGSRPDDAWTLQKEFDELLERLYGPRKFKVFDFPERVHPRLTT